MSVTFSGIKTTIVVGSRVLVPRTAGGMQSATVIEVRKDAAVAVVKWVERSGKQVGKVVDLSECILRDSSVRAEGEDPDVGFNMANTNARAFLGLLRLPEADEEYGLCGSAPMATVLRAVLAARASFDYRVDSVTRKPEEGRGAGGCRFISQGVDEAYFVRRLAEFSTLVEEWTLLGAEAVSWG